MIFTADEQKIPRRFSTMAWAAAMQALLLAALVIAWPRAARSTSGRVEPFTSAPQSTSTPPDLGPADSGKTGHPYDSSSSHDPSTTYPPRAFAWAGVYRTNGTQATAWASAGRRVWLIPAAVDTTRRSIEDDIFNHLWQSTLFALVIGLLSLALRKKEARPRYWLWCAASVKFLLPVAALERIGGLLPLASVAPASPASIALTHIAEPFTRRAVAAIGTATVGGALEWLPTALWLVWFVGAEFVVLRRIKAWRRVREAARDSRPVRLAGVSLPDGIAVRSSDTQLEPATIGIVKPVLLLPSGIDAHLSAAELKTVVDHEACHIRCRDNLTAGIQMLIEAVFWFHPLVWWIGARMVDERERACDEFVLASVENPRAYADAILHICQRYVYVGLSTVPGVGGGDLRRRIERIMRNEVGQPMGSRTRAWLAAGAAAAVLLPVGIGAVTTASSPSAPSALGAQAEGRQTFEVVSIRPVAASTAGSGWRNAPGRITGTFAVKTLVSLAFAEPPPAPKAPMVPFPVQQIVGGPDWIDTARFTINGEAPQDGRTDTSNPVAFGRPLAPFLKSLLEDRFKLTTHLEKREFPVYALIVARSDGHLGPHLRRSKLTQADCDARREHPSPDAKPCGLFVHQGDPLSGVPLSRVIGFLGPVDRIVVDRTGLDGLFDMEFQREDGVSVFTAIQEQFGLKLDPRREPLDALVIDHVEKPSSN